MLKSEDFQTKTQPGRITFLVYIFHYKFGDLKQDVFKYVEPNEKIY